MFTPGITSKEHLALPPWVRNVNQNVQPSRAQFSAIFTPKSRRLILSSSMSLPRLIVVAASPYFSLGWSRLFQAWLPRGAMEHKRRLQSWLAHNEPEPRDPIIGIAPTCPLTLIPERSGLFLRGLAEERLRMVGPSARLRSRLHNWQGPSNAICPIQLPVRQPNLRRS